MYVNVWYACLTFHHLNMCRSESHALLIWNHFCRSFTWLGHCLLMLRSLWLSAGPRIEVRWYIYCWDAYQCTSRRMHAFELSPWCRILFFGCWTFLMYKSGVFTCNQFINSTIGVFVSSTKAETNSFILFLWLSSGWLTFLFTRNYTLQ